MFGEIVVICLLFTSYNCLGIIYSEKDATTIDPIVILQELKNERFEMRNKQLSNTTTNGTIISGTLSNVTNAVTTTVSNVYNRLPCSCVRGQCGCCTGRLLESFGQKACLNVTYEPEEFAFNAAVSLNGRVLYKNRISGKNPPPICIRVPRIRAVQLCVRFSNVYFTGPNMHTCVGMQANWEDFTLFDTLFDCFRIGAAGVAVVPPEDGGGIAGTTDEDDDDDDDDDDEDYDDSARSFSLGLFRNKL